MKMPPGCFARAGIELIKRVQLKAGGCLDSVAQRDVSGGQPPADPGNAHIGRAHGLKQVRVLRPGRNGRSRQKEQNAGERPLAAARHANAELAKRRYHGDPSTPDGPHRQSDTSRHAGSDWRLPRFGGFPLDFAVQLEREGGPSNKNVTRNPL